jgi:uncharacterized protein DUF6335
MAKSRTRRASARKAAPRKTRKKKAAPRPRRAAAQARKTRKVRGMRKVRAARKVRKAAPKPRATKKTTVASKKTASASKKRVAPKKKAVVAKKKPAAPKAVAAKPTPARPAMARPAAPAAKAAPRPTAAKGARPKPAFPPPGLHRERKRLPEAEVLPTPPSSLDLGTHPSAARSGQAEIQQQLAAHNETGPALTGGDLDANWETAYSSGDEAPGGDNPTPDQDIVDQIGRSLGVEYEDDEELKGAEKLEERDRHRWELDPASSEDYDDRD